MPQSAVQLQVDRSGRVAVLSGASEIGQGCDSMVAYITAEELGVPLEYVRVLAGDTDFTPVDLGAYSSRVTFMLGNACIDAARKLGRKVREAVAEDWGCGPGQVRLAGGWAYFAADTGRRMPIARAFNLAEARFGTLGATGWYDTPRDNHGDYRGGTIGASPAYSFTAHVAEVEVDVETGMVDVARIWVAHDCGRAINPVLVEGQMEGSVYMGFAEALMEEHIFKTTGQGRAGLHNAPSLLDYRIPTSLDTPEIESLIVESIDPEGPYGAKEAGRGAAPFLDSGDRQRHPRRHWSTHGPPALLAPECVESHPGGRGPGALRPPRRRPARATNASTPGRPTPCRPGWADERQRGGPVAGSRRRSTGSPWGWADERQCGDAPSREPEA